MNHFKGFLAASFFIIGIPVFSVVPSVVPSVAPTAVNSGVGSNTSLNWSGYVATQGTFTSVSGTWNVPSVTATTNNTADATWVGIGGVSTHDLIQAGTQALTDQGGTVTYEAWYETLPQDMQSVPLPIHAGDSIGVSISQAAPLTSSPTVWQISFIDHTTGGTYTTNVSYNSSFSSAEWVEEMPTANIGFIPLDNFGAISFTDGSAVVDGASATIAGANAQPISMITQAGETLATPSALGSDGASFTITRTNAVSTAPSAGRNPHYFVRGAYRRTGIAVSNGTIPTAAFPWFRFFSTRFGNLKVFHY